MKFIDAVISDDFIKVEKISDEEDQEALISIEGFAFGEEFVINLDKSTAIKFAKTLRTEINKIQD